MEVDKLITKSEDNKTSLGQLLNYSMCAPPIKQCKIPSPKYPDSNFKAQCGQDIIVDNILDGKRGGVFVDIGAHDGVSISNSYFLEKSRDWTGICVEPIPSRYQELVANRNCKCYNLCCDNEDREAKDFLQLTGYTEMLSGFMETQNPQHLQRIEQEIKAYGGSKSIVSVATRTLQSILQENKMDYVDFLSIDTEGSEYNVLQGIDFTKCQFHIIAVESNYRDTRIFCLLEKNGYRFLMHPSVHEYIYVAHDKLAAAKQALGL